MMALVTNYYFLRNLLLIAILLLGCKKNQSNNQSNHYYFNCSVDGKNFSLSSTYAVDQFTGITLESQVNPNFSGMVSSSHCSTLGSYCFNAVFFINSQNTAGTYEPSSFLLENTIGSTVYNYIFNPASNGIPQRGNNMSITINTIQLSNSQNIGTIQGTFSGIILKVINTNTTGNTIPINGKFMLPIFP